MGSLGFGSPGFGSTGFRLLDVSRRVLTGGPVAATLALLFFMPALAQNQTPEQGDAAAGRMVFNNACRTCHTLKEGDNRLGPSLAGVMDRKAGSLTGYVFSDAMKNAGLTWDSATLDRFIADPQAVVPGNNMKPYSGMTDTKDRADLIAFLASGGGT